LFTNCIAAIKLGLCHSLVRFVLYSAKCRQLYPNTQLVPQAVKNDTAQSITTFSRTWAREQDYAFPAILGDAVFIVE